jgi:hypothetical protein
LALSIVNVRFGRFKVWSFHIYGFIAAGRTEERPHVSRLAGSGYPDLVAENWGCHVRYRDRRIF